MLIFVKLPLSSSNYGANILTISDFWDPQSRPSLIRAIAAFLQAITITRPCNGCKNLSFQMKKCDIFLVFFAQNIDCLYMLEPPQ